MRHFTSIEGLITTSTSMYVYLHPKYLKDRHVLLRFPKTTPEGKETEPHSHPQLVQQQQSWKIS